MRKTLLEKVEEQSRQPVPPDDLFEPKPKPPSKRATQKANQQAMQQRTLEKLNAAYERAKG